MLVPRSRFQAPWLRRRFPLIALLLLLLSTISLPASPTLAQTAVQSVDLLLPSSDWASSGVWYYHNGTWANKSNGLPPSGWTRVVADPFDPAHWLVWNNSAVYVTSDSGEHWTATDDVFGGDRNRHAIEDAAFSTTEPGVWYVVSRIYDSFFMNNFGAIARGTGTVVTSFHTWLGDGGPITPDGTLNYPMAIAPGMNGEMVIATSYADTIDAQWLRLPAGEVSDPGAAFFSSGDNFAQLDGLPGSPIVVGVPWEARTNADYGSLWYTPDYRGTAPMQKLTGQPWGANSVATMAQDGVYVTGADGVYQVSNLSDTPTVTRVAAEGDPIRWVRADRQTHTAVAAYSLSRGAIYLRPAPGAAWQTIAPPARWDYIGDTIEVVVAKPLGPELSVRVDAPAKLDVADGQYTPNPFTITATVTNLGTDVATDVRLNLTLPAGLTLAGDAPLKGIGELQVNQSRQVSWSVSAAAQGQETTLT